MVPMFALRNLILVCLLSISGVASAATYHIQNINAAVSYEVGGIIISPPDMNSLPGYTCVKFHLSSLSMLPGVRGNQTYICKSGWSAPSQGSFLKARLFNMGTRMDTVYRIPQAGGNKYMREPFYSIASP